MKSSKFWLGWSVLGVALFSSVGCQSGSSLMAMKMPDWSMPSFDWQRMEFRAQNDKKPEDGFETNVETDVIGKYTTVSGLNMITLEGVGLVVGLDGTGGDPPPSQHRTALLKEMRRRKVVEPNKILRSPNTALVVVRAYLPPLIKKGDKFDIEVRIPEGSEATSLNGGWLLESYLSERAIVQGKGLMKGHVFAKASGPVLITAQGGDNETNAGLVRRGSVLAGGVSMKERDLFLDIRSDFRGRRNVTRITNSIGKRFFSYNKSGIREPLAVAKTDQRINLKVHPRYRDNYPRYLQVIRNVAFQESTIERQVRIQKLKADLQDPLKAEKSALQLEAIGNEGIPILKTGLRSANPETQFHSAVALAYLGQSDGLKILAKAAKEEPAFRIFALAAMATIEDAETHLELRELMNVVSTETRYGAFRALTTLDENDPLVRGEELNDQFKLHVMDSSGPPMIHLTRHKKSEIVVFGANQRLRTPAALRAGRHILITAAARSQHVVVSRFERDERDDKRKVISTRVADVIRTVAEFGATYPEIAQMLTQASNNGNLDGTIEIDALPEAGRVYYRGKKLHTGKTKGAKTRVGFESRTPNLFSNDVSKKNRSSKTSDRGTASLTDLGDEDDDKVKPKTKPKRKNKWYDPLGLFNRPTFVSPE